MMVFSSFNNLLVFKFNLIDNFAKQYLTIGFSFAIIVYKKGTGTSAELYQVKYFSTFMVFEHEYTQVSEFVSV